MSKRWLPLVILIVVVLVLVPIVAGCGSEEAPTATTASSSTEAPSTTSSSTADNAAAAAAADAAVAAVTKSASIETPPTLKAGELQAGSDTSFPPMEFSDGKGGYIGFDVDLCTALAKKMGLELKVVSTAWDGIIPNLVGNRFDIIMSAMTITPERQQQINFTDPYLPGILAITAPVEKPVKSEAELVGKVVGVQVDTTGQFAVEEIQGVKEIKKYGTILEAFQDLQVDRVECVVNDEPVNAYIIKDKPQFANSGKIVTDNSYGFAIKKGNDQLLTAMNAALKELRQDGVYAKILAKWELTGN